MSTSGVSVLLSACGHWVLMPKLMAQRRSHSASVSGRVSSALQTLSFEVSDVIMLSIFVSLEAVPQVC